MYDFGDEYNGNTHIIDGNDRRGDIVVRTNCSNMAYPFDICFKDSLDCTHNGGKLYRTIGDSQTGEIIDTSIPPETTYSATFRKCVWSGVYQRAEEDSVYSTRQLNKYGNRCPIPPAGPEIQHPDQGEVR